MSTDIVAPWDSGPIDCTSTNTIVFTTPVELDEVSCSSNQGIVAQSRVNLTPRQHKLLAWGIWSAKRRRLFRLAKSNHSKYRR